MWTHSLSSTNGVSVYFSAWCLLCEMQQQLTLLGRHISAFTKHASVVHSQQLDGMSAAHVLVSSMSLAVTKPDKHCHTAYLQ